MAVTPQILDTVPAVLITVEGIDGAGKTALVAGLAQELRGRGQPVDVLREPGGVELSERLRELVKDASLTVGPRAEALIYAAARAQLVDELLRPLLDAGRWVLLDRFVDSSLAYQGGGRGLGIDVIRSLNAFGTGGLEADLTLLLRLDPAVALARAGRRGEGLDRLESEQLAFWEAVAAAYDELAAAEPERIRVLDAAQTPARVLADALAQLDA
jgi:dTMP kinase